MPSSVWEKAPAPAPIYKMQHLIVYLIVVYYIYYDNKLQASTTSNYDN